MSTSHVIITYLQLDLLTCAIILVSTIVYINIRIFKRDSLSNTSSPKFFKLFDDNAEIDSFNIIIIIIIIIIRYLYGAMSLAQYIQRRYIHQVKSVLCIKFYVYDLSNKKVLILALNEARDGAQRAAGSSKFYRMGAAWRKALSPYVLSLALATHSRLLCPERRVQPGWYHCSKLYGDTVERGRAGLCT